MNSEIDPQFRRLYRDLSPSVRRQAREAYRLFQQNPWHRSLHFKRVHTTRPIWSARVNRDVRVLGEWIGDAILWFFIGGHGDYEKQLKRL